MCDLHLSRLSSNDEIVQFWSLKIHPQQYVLFNLSSMTNQRQYFSGNFDRELTNDTAINLIVNDLEFFSRQ